MYNLICVHMYHFLACISYSNRVFPPGFSFYDMYGFSLVEEECKIHSWYPLLTYYHEVVGLCPSWISLAYLFILGEVSDSESNSSSSSSDSDSSSEDEEFHDGYGEDLMGDEEDRARLEQMTEKEREQELFNRIEKREVLKRRWLLQLFLFGSKFIHTVCKESMLTVLSCLGSKHSAL